MLGERRRDEWREREVAEVERVTRDTSMGRNVAVELLLNGTVGGVGVKVWFDACALVCIRF